MNYVIDAEIGKWIIAIVLSAAVMLLYVANALFRIDQIAMRLIPSGKEIEQAAADFRAKVWHRNFVFLDKKLLNVEELLRTSGEPALVRRWVFLNKVDYRKHKQLYEYSTAIAEELDTRDNHIVSASIRKNVPQFIQTHRLLDIQDPMLLLIQFRNSLRSADYFPLAIFFSAADSAEPSRQLGDSEDIRAMMGLVQRVAVADAGSLVQYDLLDELEHTYRHIRTLNGPLARDAFFRNLGLG